MSLTENAEVRITLSHDEAKKRLGELQRESKKLRQSLDEATMGSPRRQEIRKELAAVKKEAEGIRNTLRNKIDVIINGNVAGAAMKDLNKAANELIGKWRNLGAGPEKDALEKSIGAINGEIVRQNQALKEANTFWSTYGQKVQSSGASQQKTYNGLGQSINQLSREMPAFANSAQTGFMAISNNIPMLVDEINKLRDANKNLAAEGKPTQSIFQQLASAFFSWQTLISVGVTLLTVYGAEIAKWAMGLTKGKEVIDASTESLKAMNKAYDEGSVKKAAAEYSELLQNIRLAKDGFISKEKALNAYNTTIGKTLGFANNINEAEMLMVKQGPQYIKMLFLKTTAQIAFQEASQKQVDAAKLTLKSTEEFYTTYDKILGTFLPDFTGNTFKKAEQAKKAEIKQAQDSSKTMLDIANNFQEQAAAIARKNKFDFFGGKSSNGASEANKDAKARLELEMKDENNSYEKKQQLLKQALDKHVLIQREYNTMLFNLNHEHLIKLNKERLDEIERQYKIEDHLLDEKIRYATDSAKKELEELKKTNAEKFRQVKEYYDRETQATLDLAVITASTNEQKYNAEVDRLKAMYAEKMAVVKEGSAKYLLLEAQLNKDLEALDRIKNEKKVQSAQYVSNGIMTIGNYLFNYQQQQQNLEAKQQQEQNDKEKKALKDKLDNKIISQETYDAEIKRLDEKALVNQKEQARKQAELQKQQAIFAATIKVAMAWIEAFLLGEFKPELYYQAAAASAELAVISALDIPQYAKGVKNAPGGLALVGENGPELMEIPKGANIYPTHQTADLLGNMSRNLPSANFAAMTETSSSRKTTASKNVADADSQKIEVKQDPRLNMLLDRLLNEGVKGTWDWDYDKKTRDRLSKNESRRRM